MSDEPGRGKFVDQAAEARLSVWRSDRVLGLSSLSWTSSPGPAAAWALTVPVWGG